MTTEVRCIQPEREQLRQLYVICQDVIQMLLQRDSTGQPLKEWEQRVVTRFHNLSLDLELRGLFPNGP